jgi:hypothetical protein
VGEYGLEGECLIDDLEGWSKVEWGEVDVDGRVILNEDCVGRSIVEIDYKMMRTFERTKLDGLLMVESLGVVGVRKWVHFENLDLSIRDLLAFCPFLVFCSIGASWSDCRADGGVLIKDRRLHAPSDWLSGLLWRKGRG